MSALTAVPFFLFLIIFIAFFSKLVGAGVPALLMGFSRRESLAISTAMTARGAVELIIADIALRAGLFSHPNPLPPIIENMFSIIVIVAIVTTIAVPVVLRLIIPKAHATSGKPI